MARTTTGSALLDRASSSRRPLTDGELEQLYGYHSVQRTDDWYDLYQDNTVVSRRRRFLVPIVALFVAAGAAFTTYALVRNEAEGMSDARRSVLELLRLQAPAMAAEPLPERDRVADVTMAEPLVGVVISTALAERAVERTAEGDAPLTPGLDAEPGTTPRRAPVRRASPTPREAAPRREAAPVAEPRSQGEPLIMAPTTGEETPAVDEPAPAESPSSPVIEAPADSPSGGDISEATPEPPSPPRTPDFGI